MLERIKSWANWYIARGNEYDSSSCIPSGASTRYPFRWFTYGYIMTHSRWDGEEAAFYKHFMAQVFTKVNHVCWRIMYLNGIDGRYD